MLLLKSWWREGLFLHSCRQIFGRFWGSSNMITCTQESSIPRSYPWYISPAASVSCCATFTFWSLLEHVCTAEKMESYEGHDWHFHTCPWSVNSRHNMWYFGMNPIKKEDFLTYPHHIIKQVHQVMNTTWDAHMTPHSCGGAAGSGIQQGLKLVKSIWWFTLLVKFHAWQCLKSGANMQPQIWQHLEVNLVQESS